MRPRQRGGVTALVALLAGAAIAGCVTMKLTAAPDSLISILRSHTSLRRVVRHAPRHRLQVVLGRVERDGAGHPRLVQDGYRPGAEYFYPASSVKLFAAVAALERLAELRQETGLPIDADTPLVFHPLFPGEREERTDPTDLASGAITVGHEIRKLFLVSDNQAFNRLYELVGQDALARSLARAGLAGVRIVHRLSEARSAEENRHYPRIDFAGAGFVYTLAERTSPPLPPALPVPGLALGRGYVADDHVVAGPMDFSGKNRAGLADLQRGLCMVVEPDVDCGGPGFALSAADRELLRTAMGQLPRESANPLFDASEYPDDYVKFLLPGLRRAFPGARLRVYSKVGDAYGFMIENSWVVDEATGRSFFLAATLYANSDGILNDDRYDYDTVARPFLADLGEAAARALWGG